MKHLGNEARIRKELELEAVPQAIENRLRRVYAELPGEVPATYAGRPAAYTEGVWEEVKAAPRRLSWPLRGAVAACALLVTAGLLTLAMTFSRYVPETLPGAAPEDPPASSQSTPAEAEGGYKLDIQKMYCDGKELYLSWEVQFPEEARKYESLVPYGKMIEFEGGGIWSGAENDRDSQFRVYAGTKRLKTKRDGFVTVGTESGPLTFNGVYELPEEAEDGEELTFTLSLKNLYGVLDEERTKADVIPVNFKEDFTVQVKKDALEDYQLYGVFNDQRENYYVTEGGTLKILDHTEGWKSTVQLFTNKEDPNLLLRFYRDDHMVANIAVNKQEKDRYQWETEDGRQYVFYSHDYNAGYYFSMQRPEMVHQQIDAEADMAYKWFIMAFVSGTDRVPGRDEGLEMPFPDRIEIVELDGEEETIVSVIEEDQMSDIIGHY